MRSSLLIIIFCAVSGCSDDPQTIVKPLCYEEPLNSWCVQIEFATLSDGMVINRANDLDNRLHGIQYDVRVRMSRAMLGGYMTLTNNGVEESKRLVYTNDTNMIGFASYSLVFGPNELMADLYTGDGIHIDRVVITLYGE